MKKNPYISNTKLEEILGIGHTTIKKIIKELQSMSIISRIGPDKGGHWEVSDKK